MTPLHPVISDTLAYACQNAGERMESTLIIENVVQQHAEEAAFLWLLRDAAVGRADYSLADLAELDGRLEAHIDGLRISGSAGWTLCSQALDTNEPGEVFAASILALSAFDGSKLERALQVALSAKAVWRGLVSAVGWLEKTQAETWIATMLESDRVEFKLLGIGGSAVHRLDPGRALDGAVTSESSVVRARTLRSIGELKRRDLRPILSRHARDEDSSSRFWAAWSAALLGDQSAVGPLQTFVTFKPFPELVPKALEVVSRTMDLPSARNWLKGLAQEPGHIRNALVGCGLSGDPLYVPWLIKNMEIPAYARVAGEAFSMITGIDLAYEDLEGEPPEGFEAGPSEDPADKDVGADPDEDLAWPDPGKVQQWWDGRKRSFVSGVRYLCGKPISVETCEYVLRYGYQRQRTAAAFELALLQPNEPLFETRAPGFMQRRLLES